MKSFVGRWSTQPKLLAILLLVFAIVAATYSISTPLFEMSDEIWHYPMVKTIADGNGLPIQDPTNPGPWKQEGSQPPLYYAIAAAATSWVDTSDLPEVLRPNPHVDNGIITPDGNNNLVVHNYAREMWPWRGSVLAVHLARFISVLFGTAVIYFTYRIGREVFPNSDWLPLAGAAAVAFTPMFAFISGAVNNDSMATCLASVSLWLMMLLVREADEQSTTLRRSGALGISLGLAALTKTSTLGLFGLAGIATAYAACKTRDWKRVFLEGPLILAIAFAIAGWWYLRNLHLYGDLLGLNAFIAILGKRARPASLLQLWGERHGFMQSYWGLFGGVNIPMPEIVYSILNILAVLSVIGTAVILAIKLRRERNDLAQWMPTILSILWIAGVVLPLALSWARITWSSQGRLVFSAISCINLWFIAGLSAPLPQRWGKVMAAVIVAGMAAVTIVAALLWIPAHYAYPDVTNQQATTGIEFIPTGSTEPAMRLVSFDIEPDVVSPGDSLAVKLEWESTARMDRDWSVFVHLTDSAGLPMGQRDMYPGQGLIATSQLAPGLQWTDQLAIPVNPSAYSPETATVTVGLYDYTCISECPPMTTSSGGTEVIIGEIPIHPRPADSGIPNPVSFDFGNEIKLIGYALDPRVARPGESITLDLYWEGLQPLSRNYTVSIQILGMDSKKGGQKDSWPMNGESPTSLWEPDEVQRDTSSIVVNSDASPGLYAVQIVVYWVDDNGDIQRLQQVTSDGRLVEDFVILTPLRVAP